MAMRTGRPAATSVMKSSRAARCSGVGVVSIACASACLVRAVYSLMATASRSASSSARSSAVSCVSRSVKSRFSMCARCGAHFDSFGGGADTFIDFVVGQLGERIDIWFVLPLFCSFFVNG